MAGTTDLDLNLPEELIKRLEALAAARRMPLEDFLRELIETIATRPEPIEPYQR
jgi:predicted DNA binding CopG/RHH family protein